ncbi:MAG: AAA family ATPase, partial [Desulfofustis sp.]
MYNDYFGFLENPFSIAPDPRYLYMSEMHQDGLAHVQHGLSAEGCITLLTGEIGTGKTTLCRFFLDRLDPTANVALIVNPGLTAFELLATVCDEFRLKGTENFYSTKHYLDALNGFLLQAHAENNPALLVIDEAQNLDKDALEMVRLLTNLETDRQKLLKVLLVGQSELSTVLTSPDLTQVNQRITGRFHLEGLDLLETVNYIRHRLQVAGNGQEQLFGENAIKKIHQLTGGIPRLINTLCDRSLIGTYAEGKKRVETAIVKKAAKEIFGFDHASKTIEIPVHSLILGAVSLIVIVLFWAGSTSDIFHLNLERILSTSSDRRAESPVSPAEESEIELAAAPEGLVGGTLDRSVPPDSAVDNEIKNDGASPAVPVVNDENEPAGLKTDADETMA